MKNKLGMSSTGTFCHVQGSLYEINWFPGIKLDKGNSQPGTHGSVYCEILSVDDQELKRLDYYEGCYPNNPDTSLFSRHLINVDGVEGWIYEYNGSVENKKRIVTGDFFEPLPFVQEFA
jgi:gamma-glutamylcyclotransferase (GGCT)/AIG2-like uncharacterized protein YtfP